MQAPWNGKMAYRASDWPIGGPIMNRYKRPELPQSQRKHEGRRPFPLIVIKVPYSGAHKWPYGA